jgi:hypothetical protein
MRWYDISRTVKTLGNYFPATALVWVHTRAVAGKSHTCGGGGGGSHPCFPGGPGGGPEGIGGYWPGAIPGGMGGLGGMGMPGIPGGCIAGGILPPIMGGPGTGTGGASAKS